MSYAIVNIHSSSAQYQCDVGCGVQQVEDGVQRGVRGVRGTDAHQESERGEQHSSASAHVLNGVLVVIAVVRAIARRVVRGIKMLQHVYRYIRMNEAHLNEFDWNATTVNNH